MTALFIAAFLMGSVGSVHCIGMCGPLALSLPFASNDPLTRFIGSLLYNFGRMFTYGVLGAIFGLIGISFAWFGLQQWLSILLGIIILLFVFLPKINGLKSNHLSSFFAIVRNRLGNLFTHKKFHSLFFIGLLNGLLPCGLIYTALAAAVSTGSVVESSLFMMYFALGTLPVMWSMAFFGGFINIKMRQGIKKCYPYFMAAMAILLIIRGSGLDIPYISPILHQHGHGHSLIECH